MKKSTPWTMLVLLIAVIIYNGLATTLPLNGKTTQELSDAVPMYITPPGYVFSIWGFIYLITLVWVIRLLLGRSEKPDLAHRTFKPFLFISIANIGWITLWHFEFVGLSVLVMLFYLVSLIWIYTSIQAQPFRFFDRFPFSVHMGWISVATIVNISYWFNTIGFDGFGLSDAVWTNGLLLIATLLALWIDRSFKDVAYMLVFVWAFVGIGLKALTPEPTIAYVAFGLGALLFIRSVYFIVKRRA